MDALLAKGAAAQAESKRRRIKARKPSQPNTDTRDATLVSISGRSQLPRSLRTANAPSSSKPEKSYSHLKDLKLRTHMTRINQQNARSKELLKDAELLLPEDAGRIEVEEELERTWRVTQDEILESSGTDGVQGRQEWKLDGGTYRSRYTRNGRHLAICGSLGHVASFDWRTGSMHAELQLQETCKDITFLHDHSHFAVAQKKHVYIYDKNGVELHRLNAHIEPNRIEFLPYHWLLASVGNAGYLKYQDTSTGQLLVEHRTKLGSCRTMTQNRHNAVIYLGHQNGTVTLWTPNLSQPAVRLLAHLGPINAAAVDPSNGGRYMATAGQDSMVKVWDCRNWKGAVREWRTRGGGDIELEWSARGALAQVSGGSVNVYMPPAIHEPHFAPVPPPLYITHPIKHKPLISARFCPFTDILTIGHAAGLSSIMIPGSGEPNFDSRDADPFEHTRARREREVRGLLDKLPPDMITLDPTAIGSLVPASKLSATAGVPFARLPRLERLKVSGAADEPEEVVEGQSDKDEDATGSTGAESKVAKVKRKRKDTSLKRYLKKKRKNVIDPSIVAIRAKLDKQRAETERRAAAARGEVVERHPSALDRFRRG